jgi:erythromycin esterase-like protein
LALTVSGCSPAVLERAPAPPNVVDRIAASAQAIQPELARTGQGFAALDKLVEGKRIVMLGEPWHGDGGAIRLRGEIVRYLHERHGFNVLAFENDMYSLVTGWIEARSSGRIPELASENVFRFWSMSAASRPLWEYIAEQARGGKPLHVTGVDTRHVGARARSLAFADVQRWAHRLTDLAPSERTTFENTAKQFLEREFGYTPSAAERALFFKVLDALALSYESDSSQNSFGAQEVRNLRSAARYTWLGANRDRAMGDNFAWVALHQYPREKIILWAHNNHLITDKWMYFDAPDTSTTRVTHSAAGLPPALRTQFTYLGADVREYFGRAAVSIATLSHTGSYSPLVQTSLVRPPANIDSTVALAPAPPGTLEDALARRGHTFAFVDLRPFRSEDEAFRTRALDYSQLSPYLARYGEGYDAFLFIRETIGLNQTPSSAWQWSR